MHKFYANVQPTIGGQYTYSIIRDKNHLCAHVFEEHQSFVDRVKEIKGLVVIGIWVSCCKDSLVVEGIWIQTSAFRQYI